LPPFETAFLAAEGFEVRAPHLLGQCPNTESWRGQAACLEEGRTMFRRQAKSGLEAPDPRSLITKLIAAAFSERQPLAVRPAPLEPELACQLFGWGFSQLARPKA
jgi:hypothetical protein